MSGVPTRRLALGTLSGLALCAWCGWASGFHHSTTPAFATWFASLAGVVVFDALLWRGRRAHRVALHVPTVDVPWPRPGQGGRSLILWGLLPWLCLGAVVLAWEVLGIDTGPHEAHLTISALAEAFRGLNAALLLVWIVTGLGYGVARARLAVEQGADGAPDRLARRASPGALAVVTGRPTPMPALLLPANRAFGVAFWAAVIVVAVVVDLVARRSGGRLASAGELVRLISRPRAANLLLIVLWVYSGWHLFAH